MYGLSEKLTSLYNKRTGNYSATALETFLGEKADGIKGSITDNVHETDNLASAVRECAKDWAKEWARRVNAHNYQVYDKTLELLQDQIRTYLTYQDIGKDEGFWKNTLNVGKHLVVSGADWVVDTAPGNADLRVDDAFRVVDEPASCQTPNPPYVNVGDVFVTYIRRDNADPTRGCDRIYQDFPAEIPRYYV